MARANRLQSLRLGYRSAFREWISAVNVLRARRGFDQESVDVSAQARADKAALAYSEARDELTEVMLSRKK